MRLTQRRLNPEDFKGADKWVPPMVANLNLQREDLVELINGNLSIGDNIAGQVQTVTFSTGAGYAGGDFPSVSFAYLGYARPRVVLIGQLIQTRPAAPILTATSLSWTYINSQVPARVRIDYVAGLLPSTTYQMTVVVL